MLLKQAGKLISLFLLLLISFIYTDKVFKEALKTDPLMQEVMDYKETNSIDPTEPTINDDEMVLGVKGKVVNEEESYNNMKDDGYFSKDKVVFDGILPNTSVSSNYDYYITSGNRENNYVSVIFKVSSSKNLNNLLKLLKELNVTVNFFVDGSWLEDNTSVAFKINDLESEIYNLGYNGKYDKTYVGVTNNLIESITLSDAGFCLNESKDDDQKDICSKKKMLTLTPSVINPSISSLKENLSKGMMISYDLNTYDLSSFKLMVNTIESRGYELVGLKTLIQE